MQGGIAMHNVYLSTLKKHLINAWTRWWKSDVTTILTKYVDINIAYILQGYNDMMGNDKC